MPYADILLVYDLLGAAIARGQLDVAQYDGKYTRSEVLSCLCMLWRERLIKPPVVSFVPGSDSVISFEHGADEDGRGMHRLLRQTLLVSPGFSEATPKADVMRGHGKRRERGSSRTNGGRCHVLR